MLMLERPLIVEVAGVSVAVPVPRLRMQTPHPLPYPVVLATGRVNASPELFCATMSCVWLVAGIGYVDSPEPRMFGTVPLSVTVAAAPEPPTVKKEGLS